MSWSFGASVGCAGVAGACLARSPGQRLARLRSSIARRPDVTGLGNVGEGSRRTMFGLAGDRLGRARSGERTRVALIELADGLSAELRAGAAPREALARAARDQPVLAPVAAAARSPTGDVVSALHELATCAGGAAAADLATAWVVCESTGGRLAAPVTRLAGAWRDEEQVRREVSAALAGPRATAVLLAGLPLVGLAMSASLGADPLGLLTSAPVALSVLVPGLVLEGVGLLWITRITRRAATW
jgi:tight adherence protein B